MAIFATIFFYFIEYISPFPCYNNSMENTTSLIPITNISYDESLTYLLAQDKNDGNPTHHDFEIRRTLDNALLCKIHFQQGALDEKGPNGVLNEDLLLAIIDRVESFQNSKLKCRENEIALEKLNEALFWLNLRNNKRMKAIHKE